MERGGGGIEVSQEVGSRGQFSSTRGRWKVAKVLHTRRGGACHAEGAKWGLTRGGGYSIRWPCIGAENGNSCAGINRHEAENAKFSRERASDAPAPLDSTAPLGGALASPTARAPSLSRGSLCRSLSEIRAVCANERPYGSVRGVSGN